ncbi:hypothetical protein JCM21900_004815 [Sporobolomyces salmonicolor]
MSCFSSTIFCLPSPPAPSPPPISPHSRFDVARPAKLVRRSSLRPGVEPSDGEPWLQQPARHLKLAVHGAADEEALRARARTAQRECAEWERTYARGLYDVQYPPPPPFSLPSAPSAPSQLNPPVLNPPYAAPPAPDESLRQRTVDKLDIYRDSAAIPVGSESTRRPPRPKRSSQRLRDKRTVVPSALRTPPLTPLPLYIKPLGALNSPTAPFSSSTRRLSPPPSSTKALVGKPASCSLIQHPMCRELVSECREVFDTAGATLTIFDEDRLVFLASSGVEQNAESIPRQESFSAHTVLNRHRGFVVLDAARDWRFANNFFTRKHGFRFYAGFPLTLPTDLRHSDSPRVAIGSLCLTDKLPRSAFPDGDRQKLARLAAQASLSIEEWARARLAVKVTQLDAGFKAWQRELELAHASWETASPLSARSQHRLDLSTRSIAAQLDLPLVYVLSLAPSPSSSSSSPSSATLTSTVRLLSCAGVPSHPLGFSLDLHVKALQAPEGGLVYENPAPSQGASSYSGGILLAIASGGPRDLEEGKKDDGGGGGGDTRGCVLAVFKREKKRIFGKEELLYLRKFAEALGACVEGL